MKLPVHFEGALGREKLVIGEKLLIYFLYLNSLRLVYSGIMLQCLYNFNVQQTCTFGKFFQNDFLYLTILGVSLFDNIIMKPFHI